MNPIEHVWDIMKRTIWRENPPQNKTELRQATTEAWQRLPQTTINRFVLSICHDVLRPFFALAARTHAIDSRASATADFVIHLYFMDQARS